MSFPEFGPTCTWFRCQDLSAVSRWAVGFKSASLHLNLSHLRLISVEPGSPTAKFYSILWRSQERQGNARSARVNSVLSMHCLPLPEVPERSVGRSCVQDEQAPIHIADLGLSRWIARTSSSRDETPATSIRPTHKPIGVSVARAGYCPACRCVERAGPPRGIRTAREFPFYARGARAIDDGVYAATEEEEDGIYDDHDFSRRTRSSPSSPPAACTLYSACEVARLHPLRNTALLVNARRLVGSCSSCCGTLRPTESESIDDGTEGEASETTPVPGEYYLDRCARLPHTSVLHLALLGARALTTIPTPTGSPFDAAASPRPRLAGGARTMRNSVNPPSLKLQTPLPLCAYPEASRHLFERQLLQTHRCLAPRSDGNELDGGIHSESDDFCADIEAPRARGAHPGAARRDSHRRHASEDGRRATHTEQAGWLIMKRFLAVDRDLVNQSYYANLQPPLVSHNRCSCPTWNEVDIHYD
ncbi:hypothetical protein B0H13DRAFT_1855327 [Mycena leptocephala]|nr:hypothetical protein B0H13DRAFT_1855327 [Mycena leptocephala]